GELSAKADSMRAELERQQNGSPVGNALKGIASALFGKRSAASAGAGEALPGFNPPPPPLVKQEFNTWVERPALPPGRSAGALPAPRRGLLPSG
ncbi:MAG: hypothetical protein K9G62_02435, partial [Alphaproteobacteria bacterium]|nr:hypothetical protein [Alphaproteobacteria bacterium]